MPVGAGWEILRMFLRVGDGSFVICLLYFFSALYLLISLRTSDRLSLNVGGITTLEINSIAL